MARQVATPRRQHVAERIADFRQKIAARKEAVGKEYLSFYFVEALAYEIVE